LKGGGAMRVSSRAEFASRAAHFLGELNAIHAFREGNGRAQLAFMDALAADAGYPLHLEKLERATFLPAMVSSFAGDVAALEVEMMKLSA
jgi:cell filamentation protein